MFWLTPAISLLGMAATVLISSRVKTFMEAYQLTGSLVLFVLLLMVGQLSGVLYLGVLSTFAIGTLVWVVDAVLIYIGIGTFNRTSLIAKI
jgi:ABC-2 type transport system permease protein